MYRLVVDRERVQDTRKVDDTKVKSEKKSSDDDDGANNPTYTLAAAKSEIERKWRPKKTEKLRKNTIFVV
jgi:hypothetical protein